MPADLFLSYAREDTSKATELVRILEKQGWTVWWDRRISPGRDFELEIDQALEKSKVVIVLWSESSVTSNWVRNEATEAKAAHKLVPVLLDKARIPLSFRTLSTIELIDWPEKQALLQIAELKSAIAKKMQGDLPVQSLDDSNPTDEMSLSVRVATRVAEFVNEDNSLKTRIKEVDKQLQIERALLDLCIVLIRDQIIEYTLEPFSGLKFALGGVDMYLTEIDFSSMSIRSTVSDSGSISESENKKLSRLINQFVSMDEQHNLDCASPDWPASEVLCLPLRSMESVQVFIWFLNTSDRYIWPTKTQDRFLDVATLISFT